MLAYVEKSGEGGCDRGMGPRSDSMATTQQNVCVYDERQSKHSNQSGALNVERGMGGMRGKKGRDAAHRRFIARTPHARILLCTVVCWILACCVSGLQFLRLIHARAVGTYELDRRQLETLSMIRTLRW